MRHSRICCCRNTRRRIVRVRQFAAGNREEFPFIVEVNRFSWMYKENAVSVRSLRLKCLNRVIPFGRAIGPIRFSTAIESVNFLAQNGAAEAAASFTQLL